MSVALCVFTSMARYALVIGIAEYTGSFKSLETPVKNANAIADILDQYGDFNQVKRLPFRREAGQKDLGKIIRKPLLNEDLVRELQQFLQDANGSDVLIYYSGHGFTKLDQLSQTAEGYLAPSDCQVEQNAAKQIIAEKNGISLFSLNTLINRHNFNSLVVILDCCNAGAFLESSMVRRDVTAFDYQRDYYLITACRSSSKAYEGEEYSLLTDALLKGLSPTNAAPGNGRISGDRLFDVVGNELYNSRQEPIRMGWGRLITLVKYLQQQEDSEFTTHPFNPANPYMGLKPFEREQADYFFGREQAVRALLDRLKENRFLAVIGPSGCGKSSLVRAGLLPELEGDRIPGSREWQVEIITPGQYPLQTLTNTLEQHHSSNRSVVLFVDQFEELFTLCSNEEEQRSFIQRLNEETNSSERQTRIIVAMRGDFLDRCAKFQESADLINSTAPTTYMVIPLTEARLVAELEDSITCPAVLHGVGFEPELVSRIVDDVVNQLGAMPLLQYALAQLWDNCISPGSDSRLLTMQGYDAIGGVKGALQRWADHFYNSLPSNDQAFVKDLISELVQIGDGNEVTRRRASWERLREIANSQKQLNAIISRLVYQRLLVADDKMVEVAHEALLSESRLIKNWVEENRESIRLQQRLEIYCREWQEHDRSENYLLDAGRLAAIDEWIEKKQPRLMSVDQAFISQSRERRDRQFQAQLEQERRLREEAERRELVELEKKLEAEARAAAETEKVKESIARFKAEKRGKQIAIVAGILAVFASGLGIIALLRQVEIRQQQAINVGILVGKAEQLLVANNGLEALITSVEALKQMEETGQEDQSLLEQIENTIFQIREYNRFHISKNALYTLDISSDGEIVAAAGADGKIHFLNLKNNRKFESSSSHKEDIYFIRFSPDSQLLASASNDDTVKIWSREGVLLHNFPHDGNATSVSFSRDSQLLAASGKRGTVTVWDATTSRELIKTNNNKYKNPNEDADILGVDFHPRNNNILATTGFKNYDIALWDITQNRADQPVKVIGRNDFIVLTVRFNHHGNLILSCDGGGILKIWNLSGQQIGQINDLNNPLAYAEFSPDDKYIISTGYDATAKVWEVEEVIQSWEAEEKALNRASDEFTVSGGFTNQVIFMPLNSHHESLKAISASTDGTVRIWEILRNNEEIPPFYTASLLKQRSCERISSYMKSKAEFSKMFEDVCE